jgi:hypothetical protein
MRRAVLFVLAAASVLSAACQKSSSPAAPAPTVSTLSLSPGTDWVKIKGTEKFTVTALYTSGASEVVSAAWTSDNPTLATVDASGTVTGVATGQANVTATFQGRSAARGIRVIPDYAGGWAGSWAVTSCTVQGDFQANWCDPIRGGVFPATLTVQQTKDVVSATWRFQDSTGAHPGSIAADGTLTLTGASLQSGVTIEISAWRTVTTDNRTMTGTFTLTWHAPNRTGTAQTVIALQNFTKQ